jgi:FMNH2-dependent dimethyl sulfone monooxygenase
MSSSSSNEARPDDGSEEAVKFAYWVPNVSGGLVVSKIEQRTSWEYDYNRKLAVLAENSGFEYALSQVRYMASYGAEFQHESTSFSLALLLATQRLKVIAAVHPGLWHPGVLAKLTATADHLSNGRIAVNVVSGWFKGEFTALGEPWLEHDERYRRSEEFIRALRGIWTTSICAATSTGSRTSLSSPSPSRRPIPRSSRAGTPRRRAPWRPACPTGTS